MMMVTNEDELLKQEVRKQIIADIKGAENAARKAECKRRYDIYKDRTKEHVIEALRKEGLKEQTLAQMANRAGNISVCRKIVNKKARAYSSPVVRTVEGNPEATAAVSQLAQILLFNSTMRKADRCRELQRNGAIFLTPEPVAGEDTPERRKYMLKLKALSPWEYDVVEDPADREKPMAYVLSYYGAAGATQGQPSTEQAAGVHTPKTLTLAPLSDGRDAKIADNPDDQGKGHVEEYIWWTRSYHFTTDASGEIIAAKSPADNANPIGKLPCVNNADDQDGRFWAVGGDDIVDGAILVNKKITDMNYVAFLQGFGQWVFIGANLHKAEFKMGPNNAIMMEYAADKDEPPPSAQVLSASPPLDSWMRMVEQYIALLLTTNNLSSANVSGQLTASTFPSGIAMLIEQSESTDDITEKQLEYSHMERCLWSIAADWINLYRPTDNLCSEIAEISLPPNLVVSAKFLEAKPALSEAERLANIKARKDLGINEEVDLIMIDNPGMSREEAEKKLLAIKGRQIDEGLQVPREDLKPEGGAGDADDYDEDDTDG